MDAGEVGPDALLDLDGSMDAPTLDGSVDDASEADTGGDADLADVPFDDASLADGGCVCFSEDFCIAVTGCDPSCTYAPRPDGTPCPAGVCRMGVCTPVPPGCGDGIRTLTPTREGCDDGNLEESDACSASCTPNLLVISAPAREEAFGLRLAEDGFGNLLAVWVEAQPASGTSERTLLIRAARYSSEGVRAPGDPFTIDAGPKGNGFGIGQALTPSVAGLASGWVVAWRSPDVEGSRGDLGGIAYRTVGFGTLLTPVLGSIRQANTEGRFDQRAPSVTGLDAGASFVIAWTDGSDRASDPGLGVRARMFAASGAASSPEFTVATDPLGDQAEPFVSSAPASEASSQWSVVFTDTSSGASSVRFRRYSGLTATDAVPLHLAVGWSSAASLSQSDGATVWAAWLDRTEPMGDAAARPIDVALGVTLRFGEPGRVDDQAVVASRGGRTTVGWRTSAPPQGLRMAAIGWSLPPEAPVLESLLAGARQRDLRLLAALDGLWLSWTDDSIGPSAVVAYRLPWD